MPVIFFKIIFNISVMVDILIILSISCQSLLACKVSVKNSAGSLMVAPL